MDPKFDPTERALGFDHRGDRAFSLDSERFTHRG